METRVIRGSKEVKEQRLEKGSLDAPKTQAEYVARGRQQKERLEANLRKDGMSAKKAEATANRVMNIVDRGIGR